MLNITYFDNSIKIISIRKQIIIDNLTASTVEQ